MALWRPPTTWVALVTTALAGTAAAGLLLPRLPQLLLGQRDGVGANLADVIMAAIVALAAAALGCGTGSAVSNHNCRVWTVLPARKDG